jgi:hypothetical protein
MAHYALLNKKNIVVEVIVGIDENELIEGLDPETWYSNFTGKICKRTSYNAAINGYRKNYAGIGYSYDKVRDAFISPKPDNSIGFDEEKCQWIVPEVDNELLAE